MLKLKNLFENFDLAREVLRLYDVNEKNLDRYLAHFRVSSNAIYPFATASDPVRVCFLRLSPAEEKAYGDVTSEIRLIRWLVERGYPAMEPVPMKDGRLSACLDTAFGRYNVSCFAAVPGETLEDIDGTPAIVRGYGRALGELHALMKTYPHGSERRDHHALLAEALQRLRAYGAPACVLREYDTVCEALAGLPVDENVYGVVHYDFEPDNVLYDETTGRFGVIDFDDAVRCWYALDAVRAIDALGDVTDDLDEEEATALFLAGYREATAFTEDQAASLPLMRRLVDLQSYGTILYALSEGVADEPEWMTQIRAALNRELACLTKRMDR